MEIKKEINIYPSWLNNNLNQEVKRIFEFRYKRTLNETEIYEIVENLTASIEEILKFKWKAKYENQ